MRSLFQGQCYMFVLCSFLDSSLLDYQMIPVTCMSWTPGCRTRFVPIAGTPAQGLRRSDLKSFLAKTEVSWIFFYRFFSTLFASIFLIVRRKFRRNVCFAGIEEERTEYEQSREEKSRVPLGLVLVPTGFILGLIWYRLFPHPNAATSRGVPKVS